MQTGGSGDVAFEINVETSEDPMCGLFFCVKQVLDNGA